MNNKYVGKQHRGKKYENTYLFNKKKRSKYKNNFTMIYSRENKNSVFSRKKKNEKMSGNKSKGPCDSRRGDFRRRIRQDHPTQHINAVRENCLTQNLCQDLEI